MHKETIPFKNTHFFSSLICDYLDEKENISPFYNEFPRLENFEKQISQKKKAFNHSSREILVNVLNQQYQNIEISEETKQNINLLKSNTTFTITTGHQLNLFTGPLYFIYKIISTINLTEKLKQHHPKYNFVPIYWMATEDHDFDEINFFNFQDVKIQWNKKAKGAVGRLTTDGLDDVLNVYKTKLGNSSNAVELINLFEMAYTKHKNLADATRYLVNKLLKDFGLVILDADNKELKRLMIPYLIDEISQKSSFNAISNTNSKIEELGFKVQVNPREINLFYLNENLRERIVEKEGVFSVNNTTLSWDKNKIIDEIKNHPERFSPNVLLRPLYQEIILPNLCYIGGGGELAYWFQIKNLFKKSKVPFPILLLRNSVLLQTKKQKEKQKKLNISIKDIFLNKNSLINKKVREISNIDIDFSPQKKLVNKQFEELYKLAEQTDKSFLGAVSAQERKQTKGLEHLEKRLLKAQKKKLTDHVSRLVDIKNQLFPNESLQERYSNFSEFFLQYGVVLIADLIKEIDPFESEFLVLTI